MSEHRSTMERVFVIELHITVEELDCFALLGERDAQEIRQVIWRLACHSAAYMLAARGHVESAQRMAHSARVPLP